MTDSSSGESGDYGTPIASSTSDVENNIDDTESKVHEKRLHSSADVVETEQEPIEVQKSYPTTCTVSHEFAEEECEEISVPGLDVNDDVLLSEYIVISPDDPHIPGHLHQSEHHADDAVFAAGLENILMEVRKNQELIETLLQAKESNLHIAELKKQLEEAQMRERHQLQDIKEMVWDRENTKRKVKALLAELDQGSRSICNSSARQELESSIMVDRISYIDVSQYGAKPELHELISFGVIESISYSWKNLGYMLRLSEGAIKQIDTNNPRNVSDACRDMFSEWMRSEASPCTWTTVLEALQHCRRPDIVNKVIEHLKD